MADRMARRRDLAARSARALNILSLQKKEGVGNAGCPMHPQPVCEKMHTVVTTVAPESPGIPARGWF
jgi:hypothetical protein